TPRSAATPSVCSPAAKPKTWPATSSATSRRYPGKPTGARSPASAIHRYSTKPRKTAPRRGVHRPARARTWPTPWAPRPSPSSPNFGDVVQAILVGEVSDVGKALQDVKDRSERAFDEAIKEAQQREGSTATRDDYVFANWDPMSDYTLEHYAGR